MALAGLAEDRAAGRLGDARRTPRRTRPRVSRSSPALAEPLVGVLPQQRVEAEPGLRVLLRRAARGGLDPDQALVGERLEAVDDVEPEIAVRRSRPARPCSRVQPPANTPSRANRRRSGAGEELVAPGDRARAASAAARAGPGRRRRGRGCARAGRGSATATSMPGARRRELERQRQAAEPLGDRADGGHRLVAEDEVRAGAHARDRRTARRRRRPRAAARGGRARR